MKVEQSAHNEFKDHFRRSIDTFQKTLDVTALISFNQHDIETDGRSLRAVKIFTRQTLTAFSLNRILPKSNFKDSDDEFLDICSIASLARNLLEGFLALHFYGLEKVSNEEAELRFLVMQLHCNNEWYNIRKFTEPKDQLLLKLAENISKGKSVIKEHSLFKVLPSEKKKRLLSNYEMYKTKFDFEKELEVCTGLKRDYRLLSNLVHPVPLSFERIDNEKGRGKMNESDSRYAFICVCIATKYLASSTLGIAEIFPDILAEKFKHVLEEIRPHTKV